MKSIDVGLVKRVQTEKLGADATDGLKVNPVFGEFNDIRARFVGGGQWHAAEMPLGLYIALKSQGVASFSAIPVFPWRSFRHGAIYVRSDDPVSDPKQLEGKRVGVSDWCQTGGIVARALLADHYDVRLDRIQWVSGGLDGPLRPEVVALDPPHGFRIGAASSQLEELLESGEIAAIISANAPAGFSSGRFRTLIADADAVDQAAYKESGVFPLMHVIAVRRDIEQLVPTMDALYRAFDAARLASAVADDPKWRYGLANNRAAAEQLLDDAFKNGIGKHRYSVDDLFPDLDKTSIA